MPVNTKDWCGLQWTKWVPLQREAIRQAVAHVGPGVYRIRYKGRNPNRFVYIGQTGRNLRARLLTLASCANGLHCPYNDPHTAAPHLWLLRRFGKFQFECSGAPIDLPRSGKKPNTVKQILRGTEDMLLWRHRVDINQSTVANYGRFYPGYGRPSNRSKGRMAARLKAGAATRRDCHARPRTRTPIECSTRLQSPSTRTQSPTTAWRTSFSIRY